MATYTITLINQFSLIALSQSVRANTAQEAVDVVKLAVDDPQEWLVKQVLV